MSKLTNSETWAVITGAAGGIGTAISRRLSDDGFSVVMIDKDAEALEQAAAMLEHDGRRVRPELCDITDEQDVQRVFDSLRSDGAVIEVLVNNAGVTRDNLLFKMEADEWDIVMSVHLRGAFLCSRAAQASMVENRSGRIISLSSVSALGNRGQANYATAKAGMQGLTRTLAKELGPLGIRANAVAPGFVETDMTRSTAQRLGIEFQDFKEHAAKDLPLRRVAMPSDIASVVGFLAGPDADYVTGQVIYMNGGA